METRLSIRPTIKSIKVFDSSNLEADFQNSVLRPVLKLQNDLILYRFDTYIASKGMLFTNQEEAVRRTTLAKIFQKDIAFRNQMIGMVVGLFTLEEIEYYENNIREINKRIVALVHERIVSQRK